MTNKEITLETTLREDIMYKLKERIVEAYDNIHAEVFKALGGAGGLDRDALIKEYLLIYNWLSGNVQPSDAEAASEVFSRVVDRRLKKALDKLSEVALRKES